VVAHHYTAGSANSGFTLELYSIETSIKTAKFLEADKMHCVFHIISKVSACVFHIISKVSYC